MRRKATIQLAASLLALAAASCSGGSSGGYTSESEAARQRAELEEALAAEGVYPEHRATRVTLKDHRSGHTIGLLNESHTSKADFYSTPTAVPTYKVVPDLDMGALLEQFEEFGFFGAARPSASRVPGARVTVQVERGGNTHTLAWTSADAETDPDRVEQVRLCSQALQAVYNYHSSYQIVDNDKGAKYFVEEQRRLQQGSPRQ